MISTFVREQAQALLKSTIGAALSASFNFAAAADNQVIIAAPGANNRIVIEKVEFTAGAAGTLAFYSGAGTTRMTGDLVVPTGVQKLERLVCTADNLSFTVTRVTAIAVAGTVYYRVLAP